MKVRSWKGVDLEMTNRLSKLSTELFLFSRSWEQRRDDLIVVVVWSTMLIYALVSNILIVIGICRCAAMRAATRYHFHVLI
jgi:uncharacterized membrane protein YoaK (UPF0700 family)